MKTEFNSPKRLYGAVVYRDDTCLACRKRRFDSARLHSFTSTVQDVDMRIIDDKKDYYDSLQANDQDRSLLYVRTRKREYFRSDWAFNPELPKWPFRSPPFSMPSDMIMTAVVIGFCGKVYQAICLKMLGGLDKGRVAYTISDFDKAMRDMDLPECYRETYFDNKVSASRRKGYHKRHPGVFFPFRKTIEAWMEGPEGFTKTAGDFSKYFEENKCPIFVGIQRPPLLSDDRRPYIEYNALLSQWEFYRVFDPHKTYQEISMYLGNMAFPDRPIPHVSDEDMAAAKGFDRFSFRKNPQKKRN